MYYTVERFDTILGTLCFSKQVPFNFEHSDIGDFKTWCQAKNFHWDNNTSLQIKLLRQEILKPEKVIREYIEGNLNYYDSTDDFLETVSNYAGQGFQRVETGLLLHDYQNANSILELYFSLAQFKSTQVFARLCIFAEQAVPSSNK